MNPNDTAIGETAEVDERFVDDWVRFGLSELESYLGEHARFDADCSRRDAGSTELQTGSPTAAACTTGSESLRVLRWGRGMPRRDPGVDLAEQLVHERALGRPCAAPRRARR